MEWMLLPLKRYAQFSGRSRRKEFWMYILFLVLAAIVLSLVDAALGLGGAVNTGPTAPGTVGFNYGVRGGLIANIFTLGTLIPSLAVSVRRLHDTNRSGWWVLLPIGPYLLGILLLIGAVAGGTPGRMGGLAILTMLLMFAALGCAILQLVWYCLPGTRGTNRFGSDPLGGSSDELAEDFR